MGIPAAVAARGMLEALPTTAGWQSEIATVIEQAGSDASAALNRWAETRSDDPDFAGAVYRGAMHADLGGQVFVRTVEVPESTRRALAADGDAADPTDPEYEIAFLDLPFNEAIEAFMARRLMTPDEFRRLSDAARTRAFTATNLATQNLAARAQELLTAALSEGSTLPEFVAALRADEVSLGITASSPGYLETVFRTNVQASYGAGRYRQLTSPAVRAARPFVEYRTVRDDRVRPAHAELDGMVFRQDDPEWGRYAPPLGFQCRCVAIARREEDVDPSRVVDAATLTVRPDPGFDAPPTVTLDEE